MTDFPAYILASSPAVIYTCKAGDDFGATYISENVTALLGYHPHEFLDDSGFWKNHIHRDDLPAVINGLEDVFKHGRHVHEYRFQAKSGEYRWMRDELRLVYNEALGANELVGSWLDITDRKTIEENYRRFVGLTSDYVHYCTRTGANPFRIQWVAGAVNPISGYSIDEILQLGCWCPLVHPDDVQAVKTYLFSLLPGDSKSIVFRIVTKEHGVRWVSEKSRCEAGSSTGELNLFGAITDITERIRAEEALRDSEDFLQEAAQIARLGRWRWDVVTGNIEWSKTTQEIFGLDSAGHKLTYAEFIGTVHPDDRAAVEAAVQSALKNGTEYAIEHRIVLPDGSQRHVQEKGRVHYDPAGKPVRMVGTALDVTEQKKVEERLIESDRIKSEFIATASHELRTPLAIIQGYSEMMLENDHLGAEQHRDFLSIIYDKALALEKIVGDLLDISRVETGRIICLEFEPVDIVAELRQLIAQFQQETTRHHFSMIVPDSQHSLSVDKAKIIQVMENLLSNAIKYSPRGGEIVVRIESLDDCLQISVADQGMGISPQHQGQIFDKFYRVDSSNTAAPGLGIGLYLVKNIIEAHRGKIWVESALGRGSTIFFTLPLRCN